MLDMTSGESASTAPPVDIFREQDPGLPPDAAPAGWADRLWHRFKRSRAYEPVMDWMTRHRGALIASVCVPVSFVYDRILQARSFYFENFASAPELHDERVREVQAQVRAWNADGRRRPMCTARPGFLAIGLRRNTYKKDCSRISVNLRDILSLDEQRGVVRCEPLVNMGQLSRYLVPRGYALAEMVEMDDLTVGGLAMGLGMSINSHKFGLFQETVVAFEIVLADGRLVRATETENADLFRALPWSHGTLGFLVAVELRVQRVKPYVHLEYIPCESLRALEDELRALATADDPPDVLEATLYARDRGVIMAGRFADVETPAQRAKVNPLGRWYKPWFFKHVESFLERGRGDEYIPLRDYYHRHTRSIFWEIRDLIPFGNHPLYRWLLGWLGAPKISLLKLTLTPAVRRETIYKHVVQDIIVPLSEMQRAVDLFAELFDVYPLLIYPIRIMDRGDEGFLRRPRNPQPGKNWEMFFDLGVYGVPAKVRRGEPWDAIGAVRAMEAYTRAVGGYQCLYADTFMTRQEFEQMFDHRHYRRVRTKYGAEGAFPEVYDKVRAQW